MCTSQLTQRLNSFNLNRFKISDTEDTAVAAGRAIIIAFAGSQQDCGHDPRRFWLWPNLDRAGKKYFCFCIVDQSSPTINYDHKQFNKRN